ncbi:MAG: M48 family metallopeptidase [Coriobacteriales bacterium]|jgi:predicted metal-dependent hydrolase|nr:M48 family metallopeptidase [Coriobacteriales bacterium]
MDFVCGDGTRLVVSLRPSTRARRWRLQLDYRGILEVVIPAREATAASPSVVSDFVERNRRWIERATRRTTFEREAYAASKAAGLPQCLEFPLCKERWLIECRLTRALSVSARPDGLRRLDGACQVFVLRLCGATSDEALCCRALARFVLRRAKEAIPPFAWEICRELGAKPRSVTVNSRKSAWGVCTRAGDIRIDRRVLFLPVPLARQVVMHEAAHLKHLNHSKRFYDELFSYEGSTPETERALRKATPHIPAWFLDA